MSRSKTGQLDADNLDANNQAMKICVFGPESTGKSTLAQNLATHFGTIHTHEYAKDVIEAQSGDVGLRNMEDFARGQMALEARLLPQAKRFLLCDTDPLTTLIWSYWLFQDCPDFVKEQARTHSASYRHTLLLDIDVPWVDDIHRYAPENRQEFFDECVKRLKEYGRSYDVISGGWDARFDSACKVMEKLL